jgi:hypothetical protein
MKAYELGLKSQLLNNRLRLNTAVFRQHRSDVQIEGFNAIGTFMGKGRDVIADGFEMETTFVPNDGLSINSSFGYTNVDSSGQLRSTQPRKPLWWGPNTNLSGSRTARGRACAWMRIGTAICIRFPERVTSVTPTNASDIIWMYGERTVTFDNARVMQNPEADCLSLYFREMKLMRRGLMNPQSRHWLAPLRNSALTRHAGLCIAQSGFAHP